MYRVQFSYKTLQRILITLIKYQYGISSVTDRWWCNMVCYQGEDPDFQNTHTLDCFFSNSSDYARSKRTPQDMVFTLGSVQGIKVVCLIMITFSKLIKACVACDVICKGQAGLWRWKFSLTRIRIPNHLWWPADQWLPCQIATTSKSCSRC